MPSTHYSKKQAAIDKQLRQEYKQLTLPGPKLEFMSRAPIGAIYLSDLNSDAEDMDAKWYPMLGGFMIANGKERYGSESQEAALLQAQHSKDEYGKRLKAHYAECLAAD